MKRQLQSRASTELRLGHKLADGLLNGQVNYMEREHAKVVRDEITEAQRAVIRLLVLFNGF